MRIVTRLARWVLALLLACEACLGALHYLLVSRMLFPKLHPGFVEFVNLDRGANLPAWYVSFAWATLAYTLGWLAWLSSGRKRGLWIACALGALFLSADGTAQLHETIGVVIEDYQMALPDSLLAGLPHARLYLWGVPVFVLPPILAAVFLWRECGQGRVLILLGLVMFLVSGAGIDFNGGPRDLPITPWFAQLLEMTAAALAVAVCLDQALLRAQSPGQATALDTL